MTTQTTAITLSTSTYVTNPNGNTVITTGPAVVNPTYTAGVVQSFTNFGTLDSTGAATSDQGAGIFITVGDAPGKLSAIGNLGGLVTGYSYGVYVAAHNTSSNDVQIFNSGTITDRIAGATVTADLLRSSGVFAGGGVTATVDNSGLIEGGEGVWLQTDDAGVQIVNNVAGGRIIANASENGNLYGIKIQDNPNGGLIGTGDIYNAGYIKGIIDDAAKYTNITITSTGTVIGEIFDLGTGTLSLVAGETVTGGAHFIDGTNNGLNLAKATIVLNGTTTTTGTLLSPGNYSGFGSVTLSAGATWQLGSLGNSVGLAGVTQISDFGTLDLGGNLTGNTINMEGSVAGAATEVDFLGSQSSTPITDYGAGDQIVFATLAPGAGDSFVDSYNTATGVLTVTELNAAGASIGSGTATVSGVPGGPSLNSNSFVDINGPNGETVVIGTSTLANQGSIYLNYGETATLANTGSVDSVPVTFGNNASALGVLNTLDLNGSVSGTNSPYTGTITGFGLNDDIILGPSILPSVATGDQVSLAYAGSLLTATEFNSTGTAIGSTTIDVGPGYAANSFVALLGTDGVNIETPATVDEAPLTFSGTGTSFEDPTQYKGGLAPGNVIVAGETVSVISGTPTIAASTPLTNSGTIILSGTGTSLTDNSSLAGLGTVFIGGGTTIALDNSTGTTSNTLIFAGGPGTIVLNDGGPNSFTGAIGGLGAGDSIVIGASVLTTPPANSDVGISYNALTGLATIYAYTGVFHTDTIAIDGPVQGSLAVAVGPNGIIVTDVPCFATGTRILTEDGQVSVENLTVGDKVLSVRDGAAKNIIWVGRRTIDLRRHANPEKVIPVRIRAGAFGPGAPERDLVVSPDHALYIDGHLIEAKTLVNGATIIRDTAARTVTYHHIELAQHDVVLAEGLAAETYLDSGNRQNFDSDAGPTMLHPDFAAASREHACAKLLLDGELVRDIRHNLLVRARTLGFAQTGALDLTVKAGAERINPQRKGQRGELHYVLPAGRRAVSLLSATGVPAEISADPSDRRVLGVAITGIALIAGGERIEIDLGDDAHDGVHGAEAGQRWTNGNATIALPAYTGRAVLEISLNGQATRWLPPAAGIANRHA